MNEDSNNLTQLYQVNVVIWEGRHLALTNANSKVVISIGKKKKTIHSKNNKTDCPYFNDFCIFQFRLPLNVLLDKIVKVKAYQKSAFQKLIGSFSVELATVWSQPNHQFYHKWAVLVDPKNPAAGVRGFLKCDIAVLTKGVTVKPTYEDESHLEDNLLVPHGGIQDRLRTRIVLSVFRADSFSPNFTGKSNLVQPYVKITYGGNVRKTSIAKNQGAPVWNEEVTFLDLFPPLMQNIFIEICDHQKTKSLGNTNIDIRSLYEDGKDGFLPTFGPNFLYLYQPLKKYQRHKNCCTTESSFTYVGRLLLALRTEIVEKYDTETLRKSKQKIGPKAIPAITEKMYFEYNKFILFAAIFDALLFDANFAERNIKIQVTMGPKKNPKDHKNLLTKIQRKKKASQTVVDKEPLKQLSVITDCNITSNQTCTVKEDYSYTTFSGKFPCINVFGEWPDSLKRMYCSNVIKKAVQNCTNEINKIKYDLQFQTEKWSESAEKLKNTLADLSKSCEGILLLTKVIKLDDTNLCRERKKVYHEEIEDIAKKTKIASTQEALKADDELQKISTYLARLTKYAQDPENSFPDTEIWLLRNNRTEAQYRIRTEDVAFSEDFNYRGIFSGKTQTILFRGKKGKIKAKLDILVWFGLAEKFVECLKMLPEGLNNNPICNSLEELKVPVQLICEEKHFFQCRVHLFQGKIYFGFDNTGLADAFVRVIIQGQNKRTKARPNTLNPIWDETLVFPLITMYGSSTYLENNPLSITIEVFDKEKLTKSELIGRTFLHPLIKLKDQKYEPPNFPPKLKWESVYSEIKEVGKVLMAAELLELSDKSEDLFDSKRGSGPLSVPENIRPHNAKYRLEVLFWGIRALKRKRNLKNKMFVLLECGENIIKSPILHNIRHKMNFSGPVQFVELELPEELEYAPPFNLKLYHIGSITHKVEYVATCLVPSIKHLLLSRTPTIDTTIEEKKQQKKKESKKRKRWWKKTLKIPRKFEGEPFFPIFKSFKYCECKAGFHSFKGNKFLKSPFERFGINAYEGEPVEDDEPASWWLRYAASDENSDHPKKVSLIKIYRNELEEQPEFRGFQDFLQNFDMVTGHDKKTKGGILMAKVKAALKVHNVAEETEGKKEKGLLMTAFSNINLKFVARVYIVCGKNLSARDLYGKSDPYLFLQLGEHTINDKDHYAPKQLNPTFGKCFEFKGTFPQDYLLRIKVLDHDIQTKDDLIGETSIDIENRYYSKHHATCGIANIYERTGLNFWRDMYLPSEILRMLCKQLNLGEPFYTENKIIIEDHTFETPVPYNVDDKDEYQALLVLQKWHEMPVYGFHFVPEHVETRSLYHPSLPGIEQGKLVLWVDIFPADFSFMPPKVDITPQPPVAMELRAIVWNVVDVVLDDKSILFGSRLSDIYVKAWILSLEEEIQKTDVHYRSMNGEGNFNWRFIFHFNYIPIERKMTVRKKLDAFDMHPEERKLHCKLEIQVWDNDVFGDDYLGTLILELCSMPRAAKWSNRCTLKMLAPNAGKVNLFKIKKTRGWWPFRRLKMKETIDNEFELTGKIDLELEILTKAEADKNPAGKGRQEPNPLPPPDRPDLSSSRILNPLKVFHYILWRRASRWLVVILIIALLAFFFLSAFYAFPNYLVKKLLRA